MKFIRRAFVIGLPLCVGSAVVAVGCSDDADDVVDDLPDAQLLEDTSTGSDARAREDGSVVREGGCSAVKGPCDLVVQDCPDDVKGQRQECVVALAAGGDLTTRCVPVQASQLLPMGRGCCPGASNPCLPGLSCVGDPCVDGGPVTGRCSPACCDGDHASCGQSDPEGIGGQCDLALYVDSVQVHHVCSYRERCKPFGIEACKAGQLCLVEDKVGTAGCLPSNGIQNRQPCQFGNDCADGYLCLGDSDGTRSCRMFCLTPNSNPPFDASAADGTPGRGGCPTGESCMGPTIDGLPDWLQICVLPDGG